MKNTGFFFLILFMTCFFLPAGSLAQPPSFVDLAKKLRPTVVNISTKKEVRSPSRPSPFPRGPRSPRDEFFEEFFEKFFEGQPMQQRPQRSLGSGFIISEDGYILTNSHVVEGADEVLVTLADGESKYTAEIKGLDQKLDIALLKIDAKRNLPVAQLGNSEELQIGEWVMAIGNPFGLEETVTAGIVSAKERVIGAGPYDDFIQTDASINPGNSGGPLFNMQGDVVGINTAIVAGGQGIGFAIPINAAKLIITQLREKGRVIRGWLGVTAQKMTPELAETFGLEEPTGALVSEVVEGSPAEKAGLQRGDIIVSFGGNEIKDVGDLPRVVASTPVGEKVPVKVRRNDQIMEMSVEVGELDDGAAESGGREGIPGKLGLSVSDITPEAQRYYRLESSEGALVISIDPAGPAAEADLRTGDLILEVNGKKITGASEFNSIAQEAPIGKTLRLLVRRGGSLFYTAITKE